MLCNLSNLQGQTIDMSDQSIFNLKELGIHDEEGNNINISDPLTASQRRSGRFVSFMMMVYPHNNDPNCNHSHMTCRACVQLPLDVDGIYASIDTKFLKKTYSSSPLSGF